MVHRKGREVILEYFLLRSELLSVDCILGREPNYWRRSITELNHTVNHRTRSDNLSSKYTNLLLMNHFHTWFNESYHIL